MAEPVLTQEMVAASLAQLTLPDPDADLVAARRAVAEQMAAEADARRRSRDSAA